MDGSAKRHGAFALSKPVFFIGFMGAGKTSVSRRLAAERGLEMVDADEYLERREGRAISDIFATDGEAGFRALETDVLRELASQSPRLIGCGGGAPLRAENRAVMKDAGFVVYLEVTAGEAAARIADPTSRPLFKDLETARRTIVGRIPDYEAAADATVSTVGRTVGEIADEVAKVLADAGIMEEKQADALQA